MQTRKNNSQLCPRCRKLISKSASSCPYCGFKSPSSPLHQLSSKLFGGDGSELIKFVIGLNIAMFILSLVINPAFRQMNFSPFGFLSPTSQSLLVLGSTGTIPLFQIGRWWSLISAGFLHGGLLHIAFNMLALRQLAPLAFREFGIARTTVIYTLGSAGGFLISAFAGVRFTIGASAAICALIGALLYFGKSRGGVYGQNVFSQLGGWALGIMAFGFLMPGINNWGHGGGLLFGALLAYLLGYQERKQELPLHRTLAILCGGLTILILLWSCFNGILFLVLSR